MMSQIWNSKSHVDYLDKAGHIPTLVHIAPMSLYRPCITPNQHFGVSS